MEIAAKIFASALTLTDIHAFLHPLVQFMVFDGYPLASLLFPSTDAQAQAQHFHADCIGVMYYIGMNRMITLGLTCLLLLVSEPLAAQSITTPSSRLERFFVNFYDWEGLAFGATSFAQPGLTYTSVNRSYVKPNQLFWVEVNEISEYQLLIEDFNLRVQLLKEYVIPDSIIYIDANWPEGYVCVVERSPTNEMAKMELLIHERFYVQFSLSGASKELSVHAELKALVKAFPFAELDYLVGVEPTPTRKTSLNQKN